MPAQEHATETDPSVSGKLEGATNILFLGRLGNRDTEAGCMQLLGIENPQDTTVLSVTFTDTPGQRFEVWRTHNGDPLPGRIAVVTTNDLAPASAPDPEAATVDIRTVSDPGDLTGIGIEIGEHLDAWAETDTELVVCFHAVTTVLQYAGVQTAFRFFHVLTSQIRGTGAIAHYHLDPDAHDRQTLATLRSLFDAVVAVDDDGDLTVRT